MATRPASAMPSAGRPKDAVDAARATIAAAIGAGERDIVFTSGATESNNLAIRGVADRAAGTGNHVDKRLDRASSRPRSTRAAWHGAAFEVTVLDVEPAGSERAGVLDVERAGRRAARRHDSGVGDAGQQRDRRHPAAGGDRSHLPRAACLLHCDATQAVGKMPVDVERLGVDLMSFTRTRCTARRELARCTFAGGTRPRAIAAANRRRRPGRRLRSGTLNVPGIVGLRAGPGAVPGRDAGEERPRLAGLRDRLFAGLVGGSKACRSTDRL